MKNFVKQSAIVLLLYYIGRSMSFLSTVYLLPWTLGPSALGLYSGVQAIGFILSRLDLRTAIIRYFIRLKEDKKQKGAFLSIIILFTTLLYLFILFPFFLKKKIIIHFFKPNAPEVIKYLPISILLGYLMILNITIKAWYISLRTIIWPNFLQHVILPLLANLNILAYYKGLLSFDQTILCILLPYTINLCLLIGYLMYIKELYLHWDIRVLGKRFIQSFLHYSLVIIIAANLILMLTRVDTIMILGMCSKEKAGMYRTIAFIALLLNTPIKVINQATFSTIANLLVKNDYKKLSFLYKKTTLYQFLFSSFLFSILYTLLPYLLYSLPNDTLKIATSIFLLLASGELLYNLFNTSHVIMMLSNYFKLNTISFLTLLLTGTIANYFMITKFGMIGAATATFFILILGGTFTCLLVWYKFNLHPFSLQLATIPTILLLNLLFKNLIPSNWPPQTTTIIHLLIVLATYTLLTLTIVKSSTYTHPQTLSKT